MFSKVASSSILWVFNMTQPGIESLSSRPLVNTNINNFHIIVLIQEFLIQIIWIHLYGFRYSYLILIIFKQINWTHRWTLTGTTVLCPCGPWSNDATFSKAPKLEPHYWIQFSLIPGKHGFFLTVLVSRIWKGKPCVKFTKPFSYLTAFKS